MKKRSAFFLAMILCFLVPAAVWAASNTEIKAQLAPQIKLLLKGRVLDTTDNVPIMYQNKTYVPLRLVSEALGYEVKWDGKNQTISFELPEKNYPVIANDAFELISVEPKYDIMGSVNSYLGGINIEFVYTLTEDVERPPVVVFEILNKDRTVLSSNTKILEETYAGTHKGYIYGEKFRLPYSYSMDREEVIKRMTEDYYYRITIK